MGCVSSLTALPTRFPRSGTCADGPDDGQPGRAVAVAWWLYLYPKPVPVDRRRECDSGTEAGDGRIEAEQFQPRAERAQWAALDLYPPHSRRGPVQIELQRALCLVRSGDPSQGTRYATTTLEGLPTEHRTRFVMGLGEQVLAAVASDQRRKPAAQELHELLRDDVLRAQRAIES